MRYPKLPRLRGVPLHGFASHLLYTVRACDIEICSVFIREAATGGRGLIAAKYRFRGLPGPNSDASGYQAL